MVSVIIPSRNEIFLEKTLKDVLDKASGEIEIVVILDGHKPQELINDERITYLYHEVSVGMRAAINHGVSVCRGEFLMKLDAHCLLDRGFDVKLESSCADDWVVVPRRYGLDPETWGFKEGAEKLPVDYDLFLYPKKYCPGELHPYRWDERTIANQNILIDDNLAFQGSCWFMKRKHFDRHKFLKVEEYQGLPQQESVEIGLTTWLTGGRVVVNKNTWYAHLFKTSLNYPVDLWNLKRCHEYAYNHWAVENRKGFVNLIEKFMPIPQWPTNWEEEMYEISK